MFCLSPTCKLCFNLKTWPVSKTPWRSSESTFTVKRSDVSFPDSSFIYHIFGTGHAVCHNEKPLVWMMPNSKSLSLTAEWMHDVHIHYIQMLSKSHSSRCHPYVYSPLLMQLLHCSQCDQHFQLLFTITFPSAVGTGAEVVLPQRGTLFVLRSLNAPLVTRACS